MNTYVKKILVAAYFIGLFGGSLFAQEGKPNDLDNIYTPKLDVLKTTNSSSYGSQNKEQSKNVIQFNLISLIRANYYLSYERALSPDFSIVLGAGAYYGRDYVGDFGQDIVKEISSDGMEETHYISILNSNLYTLNKSKSLQFGFAWRYYFENDFEDREYIELGCRLFTQTYENGLNSSSSSEYSRIPEISIKNQQFTFIMGKQYFGGGKVKFAQEVYYGLGIRRMAHDTYQYASSSLTGNSSSYYEKTGDTESTFCLSLLIGYKFGLGW